MNMYALSAVDTNIRQVFYEYIPYSDKVKTKEVCVFSFNAEYSIWNK